MLTASLVAVWLVQAPPGWPGGAPTVTPQVREWDLAGAFVLKQEHFLVWEPVIDPNRPFQGWLVEARPMWTLELVPAHPRLTNVSLMLESLPANGPGVGFVRPKIQYKVPGTEVRVGVMGTVLAAFSPSGPGGGIRPRLLRPMAFVSGRF